MFNTQIIKQDDKPVAVLVDYEEYMKLLEEVQDRRDYEEAIKILRSETEWTPAEQVEKELGLTD